VRLRLRLVPVQHCVRCAELEHLLQEEIGQQLTGITLLLTAARRAPATDSALDQALDTITNLLAGAIERCRPDPLGD